MVDIAFLAVAACVRFPRANWYQGHVHMNVTSDIPSNNLLRKTQNFGFFLLAHQQ